MKISVIGAGAIGSMFGGLLQKHNPDFIVQLVGRGEHCREIEQSGRVRLLGPWGRSEVAIRCSVDESEIANSDVVLLTVKSHSTEEAMRQAGPYLGSATLISIQNGLNDERLAPHVHDQQLVMGMTATNVAVLEPGVVSLQLDGVTVLGPPRGASSATIVQQACQLLQTTPMRVIASPHVLGMMYSKLALNAVGYASCISGSNFITEAVTYAPWRHHVAIPLMNECIDVYRGADIPLQRIPGRPGALQLRRFLHWLDVPVLGAGVRYGAVKKYDHQPIVFSLYQDLLRGRATEVDFINGEFVRLAEAQQRRALCNQLVADLVHECESRGPGAFMDRAEVIRRFQARAATSVPVT